jgi:hypothetical protein
MDERISYIFNPQTIVSLVIFVFWLWAAWSKFNWDIKELERRVQKLEDLDLDNRLTRMEANLDWIRSALENRLHK